jgi:hypothetical protein
MKRLIFLAKGRDKRDRKVLEMYEFEDIVSFALVAGSGGPSCVQIGMLKEVESLQKSKT